MVVRPIDHNAVKKVAEICWEFYPSYLRGSGTGNYGQGSPFKGVVMQMSYFNKLEEFDPETGLKVQSGCGMGDLNKELEKYERTKAASVLGKNCYNRRLCCGGSGGLGPLGGDF